MPKFKPNTLTLVRFTPATTFTTSATTSTMTTTTATTFSATTSMTAAAIHLPLHLFPLQLLRLAQLRLQLQPVVFSTLSFCASCYLCSSRFLSFFPSIMLCCRSVLLELASAIGFVRQTLEELKRNCRSMHFFNVAQILDAANTWKHNHQFKQPVADGPIALLGSVKLCDYTWGHINIVGLRVLAPPVT